MLELGWENYTMGAEAINWKVIPNLKNKTLTYQNNTTQYGIEKKWSSSLFCLLSFVLLPVYLSSVALSLTPPPPPRIMHKLLDAWGQLPWPWNALMGYPRPTPIHPQHNTTSWTFLPYLRLVYSYICCSLQGLFLSVKKLYTLTFFLSSSPVLSIFIMMTH